MDDGLLENMSKLERWKFFHWHPLTEIKISCPIDLAKYALQNKLQELPVFKWWVKQTLRQAKD
jgi:hypothetical protein